MSRVKYLGTNKARVSWTSMGRGFSYNVRPGEIIVVPDDQVNNIRAAGSFSIVSAPSKNQKPKVNKKVIRKEEPVIKKTVKPLPLVEEEPEVEETPEVEDVEEAVECVVEETPEEDFEDVDVNDETKVIQIPEKPSENVEFVKSPVKGEQPTIDYTSLRKEELKQICKDRGLKVSGNRDDLITRICNFSKGIITDY